MRLGQMLVYREHDFADRVRAGHFQHFRMDGLDHVVAVGVFFGAKAAGDNDAAVFVERFADGVQRFLHRGVDETAGIDDDQVGALVGLGGIVAFCPQLRQDLLGIDQRLGAAERHKTDFRRCAGNGRRGNDGHGLKGNRGKGAIVPFLPLLPRRSRKPDRPRSSVKARRRQARHGRMLCAVR
jgi:hypothetical protein